MFNGIICHININDIKCQVLKPSGEILYIDKDQLVLGLINHSYLDENYKITLIGNKEYCEGYKKQIKEKEKNLYTKDNLQITVMEG